MPKYRIYANGATPPQPPPGDDETTLEKGTDFDKFVSNLLDKVLILSTKPTQANLTSQIDSSDDVIKWFARFDQSPEISLTFLNADQAQSVQSFKIKMITPWPMTFTSQPNDLTNAFGSLENLGIAGFAKEGQWLVCGLDSATKPVVSSVKDLFECACIPSIVKYVPGVLLGLAVTMHPGSVEQKKPRRNAVWFAPSSAAPRTVIRLQFQVDAAAGLQMFVNDHVKGLNLSDIDVICKQNWVLTQASDGPRAICKGQVTFTGSATIQPDPSRPPTTFQAAIELMEASMIFTLVVNAQPSSGASTAGQDVEQGGFLNIVEWLAGLHESTKNLKAWIQQVLLKEDLLSNVHIRRLVLNLDTRKNPDNPTLASFKFDIEVSTTALGQDPKQEGTTPKPIAFLITCEWSKRDGPGGTLSGKFWNDFGIPPSLAVEPLMEEWEILVPLTNPLPATEIHLSRVIPGIEIDSIPDTLPSVITRAYLSLSTQYFGLGGTIAAQTTKTTQDAVAAGPPRAPQPYLGEVSLDTSYAWGDKTAFTLKLGILAGLRTSDEADPKHNSGATLKGSLVYRSDSDPEKDKVKYTDKNKPNNTNGQLAGVTPGSSAVVAGGNSGGTEKGKITKVSRKWELIATLDNLYASSLVDFFDPDASKHVMPLINSIVVDHLNVKYTYAKSDGKAAATSFSIDGILRIAAVELKLTFTHVDGDWKFSAILNPQNREATLGDILHSLLGESDGLELPDFVSSMKFLDDGKNANAFTLQVGRETPKPEAAASGGTDAAGSNPPPPPVKFFYLITEINIAKLGLTFAQIHSTAWAADAPSKRLFRAKINLDNLPTINVNLVGEIKLPLDEMFYLWTQDKLPPAPKDPKSQPRPAGFLRSDVTQLNSIAPFSEHTIMVQDKFKEPKPDDLLIAAGSYIGILGTNTSGKQACILGYDFNGSSKKPVEKESTSALTDRPADESHASVAEPTPASGGDANSSAHAPMKKKSGPLTISNVGLKYKDQILSVILDASFELGPLAFSMLGFSIGLEIKTLDEFPAVKITLEGLSAAFDKPPLTIAGVIRHGSNSGVECYAGGLIVGYVPYQFMAAGFYGTVTPKVGDPYTSVFVFAKLDGPLVSMGFAEITGVTGGFGYNSSARVPAIEDVVKYPLVAPMDLGNADNALKALETLTDPGTGGWFSPANKTYWAAAGLKVDAFQMVSIDAVLLVQFGNGTVKLAIFAVAVADIPTSKSPLKLAHVELGMALTVDPDYGILKVEAQLAPGSYILAPECHLTGGMALVYWFDGTHADKDRVGDFVFTLGGYHEAMVVPPGWPNPPRLGISWGLGGALSLSGQAYFAVTPKVCMAGARLHASFSAGPISAWFDAFADFLVNYKPFHFIGHVSIAVGVSLNIDFLFIHTHISVEIGAELTLWGPPLAGTVYVDLWISSFTIDFGVPKAPAEHVTLYQFYLLVLPASLRQAAKYEDKDERDEKPRPDNEGHNFIATSGLLTQGDDPRTPADAPWKVRGGALVFVAECKMPVSRVLLETGAEKPTPVKFVATDPNTGETHEVSPPSVYSKPMLLDGPMDSTFTVEFTQGGQHDDGWQLEMAISAMPNGLWAKYNSSMDPSSTTTKTDTGSLLDTKNGTMPLMTGLRVIAPPSKRAPDPFYPFKTAEAFMSLIQAKLDFPDGEPAGDNKHLHEPLPSKEDLLPPEHTDKERDAAIVQQYEDVIGKWRKPDWTGDEVKNFVDVWQKTLGWTMAAQSATLPVVGAGGRTAHVPTPVTAPPVDLPSLASIPEHVSRQFGMLYVAPPLLTAATAA